MRGVLTRFALVAGVAVIVAACQGIGDGNTLAKLEIIPSTSATQVSKFETGGTYRLYQCLRDELLLQGTFGNGTLGNFNSRATWSSSDEAVVRVSNRDIPLAIISAGGFSTVATQPYAAGTLIPTGIEGGTATVTAKFAGLSASINVVIRKPQLKIVPVPHSSAQSPLDFPGPASLGVGTQQRLALIGNFDGRVSTSLGASVLNSVLNPVLWRFSIGEYRPTDDDATTVFDNLSVIPTDTPQATLNNGGAVRGLIAGGGPYEVEASLSLCPDVSDVELKPTTTVQVLPFATTTPAISVAREAGFHDAGSFTPPSQFNDQDMVIGSNQQLSIVGHLDFDGDGVADPGYEQDLGQQIRYNIEPKDFGCDTTGVNCVGNSLYSISANDTLLSAVAASTGRLNDGFDLVCLTNPTDNECDELADATDLVADTDPDPVTLEGCFPFCRLRHASLAITSVVGSTVTLEASAFGLSGAAHYVFNCGDGSALHDTAAVNTTDCDYTGKTGPFTASVRFLDNEAAVSVNAGAVQVSLDEPAAGNTPPTATLFALPNTVTAPGQVLFSVTAFDLDVGDSIKVYEFMPEPGVTIRQSSSTLIWTYLAQPAAAPSVVVYDRFGTPNSTAATVPVTVNAAITPTVFYRSAVLPVLAIAATPCALEIVSPATTTEIAFTLPGLLYQTIASFVATKADGTQVCTDALIGTQSVSRYVAWAARPDAESTDVSDYVTIRGVISDYQRPGQALYLANPATNTTVAITAVPGTLTFLKDIVKPTAAMLTVVPCTSTCTP